MFCMMRFSEIDAVYQKRIVVCPSCGPPPQPTSPKAILPASNVPSTIAVSLPSFLIFHLLLIFLFIVMQFKTLIVSLSDPHVKRNDHLDDTANVLFPCCSCG